MFKRILAAAVLVAGAAHADDTHPVLIGISECAPPGIAENQVVKVTFTLTAAGAIEDMKLAQSSGSSTVDERAMKCIAGYTFKPATHDGVPVAVQWHSSLHWGRVQDMDEPHKSFAKLERDADIRCHKLYPVDRRFADLAQPISLVIVSRQDGGETQFVVQQSAGEKLDRNAIACLSDIVKEHDDLPATFARGIAVDWSHRHTRLR